MRYFFETCSKTLDTLGLFTVSIITTDKQLTVTNCCFQLLFKTEIFRISDFIHMQELGII
jgi:hypothetical protein